MKIPAWLLVGPFAFSAENLRGPKRQSGGLNEDFLAEAGRPEGALTESDLLAAQFPKKRIPQRGAYVHLRSVFPGGGRRVRWNTPMSVEELGY